MTPLQQTGFPDLQLLTRCSAKDFLWLYPPCNTTTSSLFPNYFLLHARRGTQRRADHKRTSHSTSSCIYRARSPPGAPAFYGRIKGIESKRDLRSGFGREIKIALILVSLEARDPCHLVNPTAQHRYSAFLLRCHLRWHPRRT